MPTNTLNRATRVGSDLAGEATDEARDVASTAAERGGQLVQSARDETRELAGTVRERAGEVTNELADQGRNVANETRDQLEARAAAGAHQLASSFRDLGEQAQALAEGRPEDAPTLTEYVGRAADGLYGAADRLYGVSEDIEQRGIASVLGDLETFARRRPGAFLLGAAALGFGVGRAVKAERERRSEDDDGYTATGSGPGSRAGRPSRAGTTGVRRQAALPAQSRAVR